MIPANLPDSLAIGIAGVFGALLGSFLNVCILRWGAEPKQSVVRPPSHCPRCGHQIRWYENIPIVSWIALGGRCSGCGMRISPLYPAVELATALLWAGSVALLGPTLAAVKLAVAATLLVGIAISDARAYIIPHELSIGGTVIALGFAVYPDGSGLTAALQGALFGAGLILLVGELTELALGQEAMGGGDCALMGMVGAFFGWQMVLPVVALGALISLVLYMVAAMAPGAEADEGLGEGNAEPRGLRWGRMFTVLGGGLVLLGFVALALRGGVAGPVLLGFFHAAIGAGAAYYLSFALPERMFTGGWPRVRGLIGAAGGIVAGGWPSVAAAVAGLAIVAAALWAVRRVEVAASPETTEELSSGGYIPFGVGLALAAGILAYTGGAERMRQAFSELAPIVGLG